MPLLTHKGLWAAVGGEEAAPRVCWWLPRKCATNAAPCPHMHAHIYSAHSAAPLARTHTRAQRPTIPRSLAGSSQGGLGDSLPRGWGTRTASQGALCRTGVVPQGTGEDFTFGHIDYLDENVGSCACVRACVRCARACACVSNSCTHTQQQVCVQGLPPLLATLLHPLPLLPLPLPGRVRRAQAHALRECDPAHRLAGGQLLEPRAVCAPPPLLAPQHVNAGAGQVRGRGRLRDDSGGGADDNDDKHTRAREQLTVLLVAQLAASARHRLLPCLSALHAL